MLGMAGPNASERIYLRVGISSSRRRCSCPCPHRSFSGADLGSVCGWPKVRLIGKSSRRTKVIQLASDTVIHLLNSACGGMPIYPVDGGRAVKCTGAPAVRKLQSTVLASAAPEAVGAVGVLLHKQVRSTVHGWNIRSAKIQISHIDASHSRQPLVKGERLVRHEVNAVMARDKYS